MASFCTNYYTYQAVSTVLIIADALESAIAPGSVFHNEISKFPALICTANGGRY